MEYMPRKSICVNQCADRMSISLPEDQRRLLRKFANREHRTAANIVELAVAEFLERHENGSEKVAPRAYKDKLSYSETSHPRLGEKKKTCQRKPRIPHFKIDKFRPDAAHRSTRKRIDLRWIPYHATMLWPVERYFRTSRWFLKKFWRRLKVKSRSLYARCFSL